MRKNRNPAAAAAAGGTGGLDLAGRQIDPVATAERHRLQAQHLAAPIRIDVAPLGRGKWCARLNGKTLCIAAAPMVKAARILIAKGYDPSCIIEMWHQHADAWALRGKLGAVAATILDGERKAQRRVKNDPPIRFRGKPAAIAGDEQPDSPQEDAQGNPPQRDDII
jgi:hypothetical protein